MNKKNVLTKQQTDEIVQVLDEALQDGPWEESSFLRAVGKNIEDIKTDFVAQVKASYEDLKNAQFIANQTALRSGLQEVFISLYSSEGSIPSWERIVNNLPRQVVSRPIYSHEEDVKLLIKSKEKKLHEAYISIYINANDILTMDSTKTVTDKLGKTLLNLKDNALRLENIHYFVHEDNVYQYVNGQLVIES